MKAVNEMETKLKDLNSRFKNILTAKIDKPDDELIYALIVKNFSDSQIILDKKLINFIFSHPQKIKLRRGLSQERLVAQKLNEI